MALIYPLSVSGNHRFRDWPLRRFLVAEDSMLPTLKSGDGLLGLRGGRPRPGQIRVFPDPWSPSRWLVKRVGLVDGETFEALSDNPRAPGAVDSREFGWVESRGSYRVIWTVRQRGASS